MITMVSMPCFFGVRHCQKRSPWVLCQVTSLDWDILIFASIFDYRDDPRGRHTLNNMNGFLQRKSGEACG
jgi:hypothetical protein